MLRPEERETSFERVGRWTGMLLEKMSQIRLRAWSSLSPSFDLRVKRQTKKAFSITDLCNRTKLQQQRK